ncbi:MAG: precorrin-2 C(20)-methyltransferase [Candidatus Nitrosocosmicus sp.]|jgi:precorrin-2/cobalt-factor-2 C20-methyltransferase|uniref:precorrin-2 C(20)-methyltransferase n=1 Tax=Candidatus Nitrosocosmicus agrestis TaxID=2563600 RepID=UPI00122E2835|nr:precorrin-2 C(20)-methyltransferase [Candidatus Nitrosocosmicus sp. SS]KAA2283774.1 precorrin-2 C(20)-methyltransferase [Candidatus Nitrosocosmicus sp. SS]KAF0870150.1 precorrin-2 C(20)-methyltransferase [Candidatus Nitrosocosmicus sp. SS]MDR4489319.1 precorrin-2 C(20)-methyltransferase [Candidatus Nitrosocosmicus sp.]HET6591190.1 precorrin-2 C(20)-methyltransferase [Candidatus Nitrosocosmicus sp.]
MLNSVLYCVGCGPGDPELITIKAINLIKNADIIFTPTARENKPSVALSIVGMYIPKEAEVRQLIFPMTKDAAKLKESWEKNAREISEEIRSGKKAVYLTVGDPSLYSTWIYIHKEIQSNYNDIKVEIVPGITSIFSFSAELKTPVGEGEEIIGIIPACYNLDRLKTAAECCDTLVFLKDGRYFNSVIDILMESNFPDDSDVYIAQDVSTKSGSLQKRKLADIARNKNENNDKYFSIMIAKKKK